MESILKVKHWKLFIVMFGIPIFLQIIMMITIVITVASQVDMSTIDDIGPGYHPQGPPPGLFTTMAIFLPVIILLSIGSHMLWQWSVGVGLQKKIPAHAAMKVNRFKAFMLIPLFYFVILGSFMFYIFNEVNTLHEHFMPGPGFFFSLLLIIPLHLFSIFCIFYNIFFIAKTIKTAELQRPTTFSDFGLEFVLTWFLPIGIWFLQPRINKLANSQPVNEL